jgi:hypothetical protein
MPAQFALVAVALVAATPATAQEPGLGTGQLLTLSPSQIRAAHATTAAIEGRLTVEFRGDTAAGCAITGVCGLAGTVTWTPSRDGQLSVTEYVAGRRRRLALALGPSDESVTTAQVRRIGADGSSGLCSDTRRSESGHVAVDAARGSAPRVSLPGTDRFASLFVDALTTRCAGPLQSDLAGALPTASLDRALARRRGTVLDLRGRRPFAAHGFAGAIDSTITVRVGRLARQESERVRALVASYAIERVEGNATTTLAGSTDPATCGRLDACGVTGTIASAFGQAGEGRLTVTAATYGRRPWRDLRAALGLGGRGRRRGVVVTGSGGWDGGSGSVTTASIQHPDGGPPCSDSAPLLVGLLFLAPTRGTRLRTEYVNQPDALRTRCAGPRHADVVPQDEALSGGTIPIRALAARRPVLHVGRDAAFTSDGYTGRTRLDLTLHLRRIRITHGTVVG